MASTIQIKNSNTAGNSPSSLTQGELAINVNDGNLFYGDGSSVKQDFILGSVSASGGFTGSINASDIDGTIDISDQTNLAGGTNLTLSGDTINLDADISLTSITASSDISASGDITANSFTGDGSALTNLPSQTDNNFTDADHTKLDGIEASADVTDTANVQSALNNQSLDIGSGTLTANVINSTTDIDITTNNEFLRGTLSGGFTRHLIGFNSSNVVEVGNTSSPSIQLNNDTSIEGDLEVTGSITLEGNNVIDEAKFKVGETSTTAGDGNGIIIKEGNSTTTAGKIYYYTSVGEWTLTDADAEASATGLLGVALGDNSGTKGMLLQGCVTLATDPGTTGDILYLQTDSSGDTGDATSTAPSGTNDIVRIIGYCLNNAKIYFNPSNDFIKHA